MTTIKPFQGPFLFVNKDATNLKYRSADEAYAIGSHVAGRYTQWSKIARVRDADPLRPKATAKRTTLEKPDNDTTREELKEFVQRACSEAQNVLRSTSGRKTAGPSTASPCRSSRPLFRRTQLNPITLMQHGNSDPFSASSVEITPFNHHLIITWQSIFMQTIFPSEVLQKVPESIMTCNDESADMIGCAERLHFLLAWTLMLQLSAMPASQTKKKLEIEALTHKVAGITSLQKRLPTMAKLTAIRAVWHLLGAEFYGGNSAAALTHFYAMVDMVKSVGGLKSLPSGLRKLVVVSDMTISGSMKSLKSAFDVHEWDPGSVTSILLTSEARLLANNSLVRQPLHKNIPLRLLNMFVSYRELLAVHQMAANMNDSSRLTALLLWAQMRQYALSTRVTNIKAVLDELPASAENFVEKATCVAVDYFLQILWLKNHTQRTILAPFHHSEGSFEILQGAAQLELSPLTVWILFVASTVELILRQRGLVSNVFCKEFTHMLESLQLRSPEQVRQSLSQFLYQDEAFDQYLLVLLDSTLSPGTSLEITNTKEKKTFVASYLDPSRFGIQLSKRSREVDT